MLNVPRRFPNGKYNPEYDRQRYRENRERILEQSKQYYLENREKILEQQKEYQKSHPEVNRRAVEKYEAKYPEKRKARRRANYHVPLSPNCELCGTTENLERHHPSYDEPLVVITVCRTCHGKIHGGAELLLKNYREREEGLRV